jgi:hypothetical protein
MKQNKGFFVLWACLFLLFDALWSIALLSAASFTVQLRYGTGNPLWLCSFLCIAIACFILLWLFSRYLRWSSYVKSFTRFASFYWLYAFLGLVIAVFFSAYVMPKFHLLTFIDSKGFDYVASYLAYSLFGGVLPALLLRPVKKKGGVVDGGSI